MLYAGWARVVVARVCSCELLIRLLVGALFVWCVRAFVSLKIQPSVRPSFVSFISSVNLSVPISVKSIFGKRLTQRRSWNRCTVFAFS